ncbi:Fe2+-dependent dioxygenase [Vineibacter terrae]|uniref:Fe2+-dependent dioxygenase n=1 Tax=Vineibacter terrae TaxID=2586908 RepID=UPI002E2F0A7C|nr:Fe2+-dependent dioxygenase [Vineibacter terrae]HEX2886441.1 Fe2+-dependent dioxygenase [Vineibacter terrae]
MLLCLPGVLSKQQVAECRRIAADAEWIDGSATAGQQSALVKRNMQLREESPQAKRMGDVVLDALAGNQLFISAALPLKILPPLFNRYQGGESFGTHVDNAIRAVRGTPFRLRTDLSATLFLSEPDEYDGGELTVEGAFGAQEVKLPAGDMVLYPASSLHHVKPVTHGTRIASFFWLQSMVRDDGERALLFDLDNAIQDLARDQGLAHPVAVRLTGIYHNLLRRWADA